jgi:hypothetical protein
MYYQRFFHRLITKISFLLSNNYDFIRLVTSSISSLQLAQSILHDLGLTAVFRQQWRYDDSLDRILRSVHLEAIILDTLVPLLFFVSCNETDSNNDNSNANVNSDSKQVYLDYKAKQESIIRIIHELCHKLQPLYNVQGTIGAAMA